MISETTPVKDLPSHLRLSYKLYKAHGTMVIDSIKANGGKFNSPKDWDFAPYILREHLKGRKPPNHIKESLNMIIVHRTLMVREFEIRRKAARKPLTSVDLAHLSFIDKIRNLQRFRKMPKNTLPISSGVPNPACRGLVQTLRQGGRNLRPAVNPNELKRQARRKREPARGLQPATAREQAQRQRFIQMSKSERRVQELRIFQAGWMKLRCRQLDIDLDRPKLDVAEANSVLGSPEPGVFVFELNNIRKFAKRYHPYYPRPLWWTHEEGVDDLKEELKRCTLNRWPVTVVIEDCYGRHILEPDEVHDFAHDTERHAYSDYDSTITGIPIKFSGFHGANKCILYGTVTLLLTIRPSDHALLQHAKPQDSIAQTGDINAEVFLEEQWWRLFNSDPPESRSYTLQVGYGGQGEVSATTTRTDAAQGLDCSTGEARTYVEMLQRRGDTVCYWYGPGRERVMSPADVDRFLPEA